MTIPEIPSNRRVITVGNKHFLQPIKRRTKRFKTPLKVRKKIAAAARRFKLPILSVAAVGFPIGIAINKVGGIQGLFSAHGIETASASILRSFTGFDPRTGSFSWEALGEGLLPATAVFVINKLGVLRPINRALGRTRMPFRLN